MTRDPLAATPRVARSLMTEEAVYGLILVSCMIVVSGTATGTSVNALLTVALTVVVFYAAHVYAGTLARLAASAGRSGIRGSLRSAARQSSGMLLACLAPLGILLLGTTRVVDDRTAIWCALIVNTAMLAALGWIAVARWSTRWYLRLAAAVTTAAFGGAIILIKALVNH